MNYSSFLQSNPPIEEIMDRFDRDEAMHRFEILEAIAGNSMFVNPAIKKWARQSLDKLNAEEVTSWVNKKPGETSSSWTTLASLAILDPQIIPPSFLDRYEFLVACIKIDAVKVLMHLRTINRPSYTENLERFRAQPLFITIEAWNAMGSN